MSIIVFLPCVTGEFLWDDEFLIVHNPLIKSLKNIPQAFTRPFFPSVFETPQITFYRPLVTIVNMFQYSLFGLRPFWWHLFNILVHATNMILFGFFLWKILKIDIFEKYNRFLIMAYAMLPIHTEAVCFISGRTDLLALFFILSGMLFFFRGKEKLSFVFSILCFGLGLLTKEVVLMFPLAIPAVDYSISEETSLRIWIQNRFPRIMLRLVPFFILSAIYLVIRFFLIQGIEVPSYPSGNAVTTWLTMPKVFFRYTIVWLSGWHLNCDYTNYFRIEHSRLSPLVIFPVLYFLLFPLGLLILLVKKKPAFLGLYWFLLFLLPVMNLFPLGIWMAERYLYIPVIGFIMILFLTGLHKPKKSFKPASYILLFFLGMMTIGSASRWHDAEKLWEHSVNQNPDNPQARIIYAQILQSRGKIEKALEQLAYVELNQGILQNTPSLSLKKEQTLVKIYTSTGAFDKAENALAKAKDLLPQSSFNLMLEGNLRIKEGKLPEAKKAFQAALEGKPDHLSAIVALMELGEEQKTAGAEEILSLAEKVIAINPDYFPSYIYKGKALRDLGSIQEAIECFQRAIRLSPDSPEGYLFLADLYEAHIQDPKSLGKAADLYLELLRRHPDNIDAWNNLGVLYARMGNKTKAREMWERVLKIDPRDQVSLENLRRLEAEVKKK